MKNPDFSVKSGSGPKSRNPDQSGGTAGQLEEVIKRVTTTENTVEQFAEKVRKQQKKKR